MTRLSPYVKNLRPSPTLAVSSKARALQAEGLEILNLSLGEPDFPTPELIRIAGKDAIDAGHTRYTPVAGIMPLRKAISRHLQEHKQLNYRPDQIVVSTGAKQSLYNAIMALVGPGDEVLIPTPYWVSYPAQVELAGGKSVFVQTKVEDNFQISPEAIAAAITPYTRMLILNSPNNPTGTVYEKERVKAIAALLKENPQIWLLTDDIYDRLIYGDAEATNPLQWEPSLHDRTIVINGFSKAYAMTGWRIGYLAAPSDVVKAVIAIQGACTSGTNAPTQHAAIAALEPSLEPIIESMRQTFAKRLQAMLDTFGALPKTRYARPDGAFYLMVDFSHYMGHTTPLGKEIHDTVELATYLLEEGHVAGVPGEAFGMPGYIRFAYATNIGVIQQAAQNIKSALEKLNG